MNHLIKMTRTEALDATELNAARLAAIVADSQDAIITKTLDGIVTSWNEGAEEMFGYRADEMIGQPITQLFPQHQIDEEKFIIKKIKSNTSIKQYETVRVTKHGALIHLSVSLSPIKNLLGEIVGVSKIARDITKQKMLEQKLIQQHAQFKVTMDAIADAVITTDMHGFVQYLNPVATDLTGWACIDALGKPVSEIFHIVHLETRDLALNLIEQCLRQESPPNQDKHQDKQIVLISRDGTERVIERTASVIQDANQKAIGAVLVFHDVTVQCKLADELQYRSHHDALTGLLNRAEFESKLESCMKDNREADIHHALIYLDLDRFKVINDRCGLAAGDTVLKDIAKILQTCIRSTDILARIGGDEFAIILHKCDAEQSIKVAKNICKVVSEYHFYHTDECFRLGASIGLVVMDKNWTSTNSLLQAADSACYEAKNTGRNRVHLYYDTDSTLSAHQSETKWVSRIEKALEDNHFVLFCQRIMPLNHQGLEHAEILIRMVDKDGTLIPPSAFLPAAERFHLASRVDRFVVEKVLAWMSLNRGSLGHIESISINLSGQSLSDLSFHRDVLNLISTASIETSKLCFEITETAAITNIADAKKFIAELNAYGVKFSLDDFGSGVSSFGYLKNLNVDYLKIDGQFITDLLQNDIGQATVRCIAEVAKVTGKKTIAEWVENKTVEKMLKKMGIDFTQGFLKHNPAPLDFLLDLNCSYATAKVLVDDKQWMTAAA